MDVSSVDETQSNTSIQEHQNQKPPEPMRRTNGIFLDTHGRHRQQSHS